MANDPPFATLNHVAGDLGIPSESALLRIGISFGDMVSSSVRKGAALLSAFPARVKRINA
jgi:hypothetical protein